MAGDVTALLDQIRSGREGAWDELLQRVYDELRSLAQVHRRGERPGHTLQTTALVNEAFLRLVREEGRSWQNRSHFLAIASTSMRRILVNYAEARKADKRGGDRKRLALDDALNLYESHGRDLLELDEALTKLAEMDPMKGKLVELRFFGGLELAEIAKILDVSLRTVERSWRTAKAWIRTQLDDDGPDSSE